MQPYYDPELHNPFLIMPSNGYHMTNHDTCENIFRYKQIKIR